ncbi:hypothetical protein ACX40Y_02395 [Sphingomonas sp. RS6]
MPIRPFALIAVTAAALSAALPAQAQTNPALSACLKAHTSKADRTTLVRWIFAGIAGSESVKDLSQVTEAQRTETMRGAGRVINRLLTTDCRAEALGALKAGGPNGMQSAFGQLGESAMVDLMSDPAVLGTFAGIVQYVDMGALVKLMMDSGALDLSK